jgi:hypothetical protein
MEAGSIRRTAGCAAEDRVHICVHASSLDKLGMTSMRQVFYEHPPNEDLIPSLSKDGAAAPAAGKDSRASTCLESQNAPFRVGTLIWIYRYCRRDLMRSP